MSIQNSSIVHWARNKPHRWQIGSLLVVSQSISQQSIQSDNAESDWVNQLGQLWLISWVLILHTICFIKYSFRGISSFELLQSFTQLWQVWSRKENGLYKYITLATVIVTPQVRLQPHPIQSSRASVRIRSICEGASRRWEEQLSKSNRWRPNVRVHFFPAQKGGGKRGKKRLQAHSRRVGEAGMNCLFSIKQT